MDSSDVDRLARGELLMAVDKLVDSAQLNADLTSIANAIRTKGGTSAQLLFPSEFVSAINAISTGSGKTLLADYTASEDVSEIVLSGDFSGYPFYYLMINGNCSVKEWIYPSFNDVENTSRYWAAMGGSSSFDILVPICTPVSGTPIMPNSVNFLFLNLSGAGTLNTYSVNTAGPFSKLSLKLYYTSSLFLSGFNVKLWGVSV